MTRNGFEFFEGTRSESSTPTVTVRRSGQMVLTPPAVAMLGDDVSHVQFGFDSSTQAVALRAAPKGAKGRYRLRAQTNGASLVDGRRFLAHHGVEMEKAQSYSAEPFGDGSVGFRFGEVGTHEGRDRRRARGEDTYPGRRAEAGPDQEAEGDRRGGVIRAIRNKGASRPDEE